MTKTVPNDSTTEKISACAQVFVCVFLQILWILW